MPTVHTELNGSIYFMKNNPQIYWIDRGLARHIADEDTYHGVFGSSPNKMEKDDLLSEVLAGPDLSNGATLVRAGNSAAIYLVESNSKRLITSELIKAKYNLNGNVHSIPPGVLANIANGPQFS